MVRAILGAVAGVAAALVVITAVEALAGQLFPVPSDVDVHDPADLQTLVAIMPLAAQAFIIGAWVSGAALGGIVSNRIVRRGWPALVVGGLVALGAVANLAMIPHPIWMQVAGVSGPMVIGGLLFLAARRTDRNG